jgi:hypothetical protein
MGRRHSKPHVYEDPNIEIVAKIEAVRVWEEIEAMQKARIGSFYHDREIALARNIPIIAKTYGKEVALRVEYAIMTRSPATLHPDCRKPLEAMITEHAIKSHGRFRLRDRISIWLTGFAWSAPKRRLTHSWPEKFNPLRRPSYTTTEPQIAEARQDAANASEKLPPRLPSGMSIAEYCELSNDREAARPRAKLAGRRNPL